MKEKYDYFQQINQKSNTLYLQQIAAIFKKNIYIYYYLYKPMLVANGTELQN